MYNTYSIESFIDYLNEEDDIATEGIKEIFFKTWEFIKRQFKKLWKFITQTIPLKIKSFLDKHPKLRNSPGIKQIYIKLKKLESKVNNTGNKIKKNDSKVKAAEKIINKSNSSGVGFKSERVSQSQSLLSSDPKNKEIEEIKILQNEVKEEIQEEMEDLKIIKEDLEKEISAYKIEKAEIRKEQKKYHPDESGDNDKIIEINSRAEDLKKKRSDLKQRYKKIYGDELNI